MTSRRNRFIALFIAITFLLTSVALTVLVIVDEMQRNNKSKNSSTEQKASPDMLQGNPLANFTPIENIPELRSEDLVPGTGEEVQKGDTLTVDYTGALASNGIVFESSKDSGQRATFPLGQVIPGWQEGIPGMKVGGTRRLFIPAEQAYGANSPSAGIPANSDLVFDVTVHEAKR